MLAKVLNHIKSAKKIFGLNVPIRDLAQISGCFSSLCLALCLIFLPVQTKAAKDNKKINQLYKTLSQRKSDELFKKGNDYLNAGKLDEAMVCFTIVGNRYSSDMTTDEVQLCAKAMNNAGGISQIRNSFSTAFSYYKKAIQIADKPIYQAYNNIAGIYLFFEDYDNARKYLTDAYNIGLQQKDFGSLCNSLHNIILLDWCSDNIEDATRKIKSFMAIGDLPKNDKYQRIEEICKGVLAYNSKNYLKAINHFKKSTDNNNLEGNNNTPYYYIARCYMQLKDYPKAIEYLKVSEQSAKENGAIDHLIMDYQYQIKCYEMMGDANGKLDAKYKYLLLKDSINTAEEFGKIKNIDFFSEVDKYEKQVIKLNEEQRATRTVAAIVIVALAVVAFLLWLTMHRNRKLKESNTELYHKHNELIKQADLERQQRKNYTDKIALFTGRISELEAQLADSNQKEESNKETTENIHRNTVPDSQSIALLEKIYSKMDDTEFICQQELTIEQLAQAVGASEKYTSQVINEQLQKNFNTLLNEYRIHEGCRRLADFEHYGNMTNEAIAEGLGFKSRSHFIRTFKKITGLTPSQYQKIALEDKKNA